MIVRRLRFCRRLFTTFFAIQSIFISNWEIPYYKLFHALFFVRLYSKYYE